MRLPGAWAPLLLGLVVLAQGEYCPGSDVVLQPSGEGKAALIWSARASFGATAPQTTTSFGLYVAHPPEACMPLATPQDLSGTVAVVRSGGCNFTEKAFTLAEANAAGLIVYNKEPECLLMGGLDPPGHPFPLFALSVSNAQGRALLAAAEQERTISVRQAQPGAYDGSEIIIWLLAVGTAVGGALWAGADYQEELAYLSSKQPGAGGGGGGAEPKSSLEVLTVSGQAAVGFVCVASVMLLLMFFFLSKAFYIVLVGMFSLGSCQALALACTTLGEVLAPARLAAATVKLPLLGTVPVLTLAGLVPAFATVVTWLACQTASWAWILQDVLGMSLMALILRQFRLPTVQVASLLLLLCLAYDVFWVFIQPLFSGGHSVMVEVASGGTARWQMPMLIRAPRLQGPPGYSMLGFGDVVLPGLLLVYARMVDLARGVGVSRQGYFLWLAAGYGLGLLLTFAALWLHIGGDQGQPALLYLIPCTLFTLGALAWQRGEFALLWQRDVAAEAMEHARKAQAPDRPDEEAGGNRREEAVGLLNRSRDSSTSPAG